LIETGSTGGPVSNSIDEVRIGSTYAEVTPLEAGHVLDGFKIKPMPGSTSDIFIGGGPGGGPHVRITGSPGTPGCAGEVEMNSLSGGGVNINPGEFSVTGGEIKIKHKGWDGVIYGTHRMHQSPGGQLDLESDFTNTQVTSVRAVVTDSNGAVIQDQTTQGQISSISTDLGGGVSAACPSGLSKEWVWTTVYYNPPIYFNGQGWLHWQNKWVYRCPEDISISDVSTVTVSGFGGSDGYSPPGLGTIEVSSDDLPALELSAPSVHFQGAECAGMGDVLITEACDDATDCDDAADRKLTVSNIGSSGQDGVEVKWRSARPPAGGGVTLGDILDTTGEAEMTAKKNYVGHVTLIKQRIRGNGDGTGVVTPDFSELGSTEFMVTAYANGSIVSQEIYPNGTGVTLEQDHIICGPGMQIVWGWVTMWVWNPWPYSGSYQTHWGVVGCMRIGTGGGNEPTYTDRVIFTPVNPVITEGTDSVEITARNISEIVVTSVESAASPLCPADFNLDGFLDFFDYDDYVLAFETGTGNADFNGDGFTDFFDYDDYVLAFETGC
jgi:hypothetical protein